MIKKKILSIFCLALIAFSLFSFVSCGDHKHDPSNATRLSFKDTNSYEDLKKLDGKKVVINGYMASSSPVDGSFIFLMNLPYQSCPFCKPNTTELSNTIEVYPYKKEKFTYTEQAIEIVGTLEVAKDKNKPFTDNYGYQFNFKIVDATYVILNSDTNNEQTMQWQQTVNDIYKMYDYVNFLCAWDTYFVDNYTDSNGNLQKGYYLYASDAENFIKKDGAQYNYGYKDGYFENIIKGIRQVDAEGLAALIKNVEKAQALAQRAFNALENGDYTRSYEYVEKFDNMDYIYKLNKGEQFRDEMALLWEEFVELVASWEL